MGFVFWFEFVEYDACMRVFVMVPELCEIKGCQCGDVFRGVVLFFDCKFFGCVCIFEYFVGLCMVLSEGLCVVYYCYIDYGKDQRYFFTRNGGELPVRVFGYCDMEVYMCLDCILFVYGSGGIMMKELIEEVFMVGFGDEVFL